MSIQSKYEILSSALVGIEFEFFSELSAKAVSKELTKALGKKVIIPVEVKGFGEKEKGTYHSDLEPTSSLFKLEKDFSGGKDMFEMITGPLVYEEGRIIIIKMLTWINEKGWTSDKCAIHLNVSFNEFKSKLRYPLMNLNVLKFILSFDEEFIYSRFPNRRDTVYAKSIYNFYPASRFVFFDQPDNIDKNDYILPLEKYYGVNFTKLVKNYLELRYLGGSGYEKKTSKILEILDYFISTLYSTLQQNEVYTPQEKAKLYKALKMQKTAVETFSNPEQFLLSYPNILITVDMRGDIQILKSYWTVLRDKLFSLVIDSKLRKGHFNLDTDLSICQLKNASIKKANHITDMELFECELNGTITSCDLYRCTVVNSRLNKCKLIETNDMSGCKIENTTILNGNLLQQCYVNNADEVIDCEMIGGVIRKGVIGKNANISKHTLIVDAEGPDNKKDFDSLSKAFLKNTSIINDKK